MWAALVLIFKIAIFIEYGEGRNNDLAPEFVELLSFKENSDVGKYFTEN